MSQHSSPPSETSTPLLNKSNSGASSAAMNHANSSVGGSSGYSSINEEKSSSPEASAANARSIFPPHGVDAHAILLQSSDWRWNRNKDDNGSANSAQLTTLTSRALSLAIGNKATHLHIDDIIGVERSGSHNLLLHSYPASSSGCCSSGGTREYLLTTLTLQKGTEGAEKMLQNWHETFQQLLNQNWLQATPPSLRHRQRRLMILINPASGAGNAERNLQQLVPMLEQSGINYRVQKTTHANHAHELMYGLDLSNPECPTDVVCVSGDGLVHEVVNGIMQREDWEQAAARLRLGHIGGGSANGLASAIAIQAQEKIDLVSSMYIILKGWTRPLDVFSNRQQGERIEYGFLCIAYGIVSDIDLESETMRYLGNARFTVTALSRICCLRRYDARLEFLLERDSADAEPVEINGGASADGLAGESKCKWKEDGCLACSAEWMPSAQDGGQEHVHQGRAALAQYLREQNQQQPLEKVVIHTADSKAPAAAAAASSSSSVSVSGKPLVWQSLDSKFTLVWAMNVSHPGSDMHVAPQAHFSDGCLDLYYCKEIGSCSMLSLFLSLENGTHGTNTSIYNIKVKGLRVTPNPNTTRSELTVDGEKLPYKPVEVRVFRGVLNLLAR